MFARTCIAFAFLACLASSRGQSAWPDYRGPVNEGVAPSAAGSPPVSWSEEENILWKTPLAQTGWSSPVVSEGRIWTTAATPEGHDFYATGVDLATGDVVYAERLFHADEPEPLGNGLNGYASPSAVVEPGRVYIHFGSYGTACLDSGSGEEIWRREDLPCRHYRGPGSSPLLYGDLLVLTMDGVDQQYLVALDKHSGETVWKTDRSAEWDDWGPDGLPFNEGDLRKAYSTPIVAATSTGEQLISVGAKAAYAYDPATGDELWKVAHGGQGVAPRPLYHDDIAFLCTGFGATEMLAIRTDARGVVGESHIAWRSIRGVPQLPSPILHDGAIYLLGDRGVLTCISEATGEEVWRLRVPGEYVSSPVLADGRIYCCNTEGVTAVVELGAEPRIVAENKLDAGFMASPAVVDGDLILRTKTHLYRIHASSAASQ